MTPETRRYEAEANWHCCCVPLYPLAFTKMNNGHGIPERCHAH